MIIKTSIYLVILSCVFNVNNLIAQSLNNEKIIKRIVPESGYEWHKKDRVYWPTKEWQTASMEKHGIDPEKMYLADNLAKSDNSLRSLLVVKDGFIVFEKYYYEGGRDKSTEVWSVTKSFTSALVGIAIDQGHIENIDRLMVDYLLSYPDFKKISIKHVLTHTTGLNWNEGSLETWVQSSDWIANVLGRGYFSEQGESFLYSSGNSHLLSALIKKTTGKSPGEFAKLFLFDPIGIKFKPSNRERMYSNWEELHIPVPGSWRQDNKGLEMGAFGLHITAREMAKFGFLYINKGRWDGHTLIPESWVEESTKDHVTISENKGFGFHWVVSKRAGQLSFDADGWGGQMISVIPALDMIVVIKCDEINPRENNSYRVLELAVEAASN